MKTITIKQFTEILKNAKRTTTHNEDGSINTIEIGGEMNLSVVSKNNIYGEPTCHINKLIYTVVDCINEAIDTNTFWRLVDSETNIKQFKSEVI